MMHADEVNIDVALIRQLLVSQFPHWADLPLQAIHPEGTDNVMYKLGSNKVVRLPRMTGAVTSLEKELAWLPQLVPHLPIAIPVLLGQGHAEANYPFPWLICGWLEGKSPNIANPIDQHQAAIDLGNFVAAMQKINSVNAPSCNRGQPLGLYNEEVREAISLLRDTYDISLLMPIWESVLTIPKWSGNLVWIHGDLHAGNLLAEHGRVTAVVDFGLAGVGDPACDMMVAWTLLTAKTREVFRAIVQPDEATWARGRGWAFYLGVVAYPYYRASNPVFAGIAKRAIDEVLAEYMQGDNVIKLKSLR